MAVESSKIQVADLDFEDISKNLKSYLKGQNKFKDYDFDGSTMSILIDLLAYASHIGAVNTNIAASELFLDSAQMRKNVVSRAKDLGFIPASEKASSATIDMNLLNVRNPDGTYPTTTEMTLQRGQIFSTSYDGTNYEYVVSSSVRPQQNKTNYFYSNINIVQGTYLTDKYIFDSQVKNSKYVLSNARVDKSHLKITVDSNGDIETYALSTDISNISTESRVYYAQENEEGFTEIYFGDGVLGKQLKDGDIITATYIVVDEQHADGANTFRLTGSINGFVDGVITTIEKSDGGAEKESIESIKFKANKFYTSQNRLVTLNDYKAKVSEYYPNADAVAVWGGEDNDPPEYGKVFLAIKPNNADYLSDTEKKEVQDKLKALNILTVRPIIISPDITKILLSTTFKYNEKQTDLAQGELENIVTNAIRTFDKDNLNNFDAVYRHSKLLRAVDDSNSSILSNTTNIRLRKALTISPAKKLGYTINFGNAFYNPHSGHNAAGGGVLTSTGFYVQGDSVNIQFFDEDGMGNLRRYYLSSSERIYTDKNAGVIDYTKGKITINAITFTSTVNVDTSIDFTLIPDGDDVVATRGSLIDIDLENVSVKGEVDTIASGETSAGVGFRTTSSTSY
tara:strand:- start:3127 stop:4998 length:1872 start_codon:yes stop_codon:yes gene_type:complete